MKGQVFVSIKDALDWATGVMTLRQYLHLLLWEELEERYGRDGIEKLTDEMFFVQIDGAYFVVSLEE